jgi:hypothetical protein
MRYPKVKRIWRQLTSTSTSDSDAGRVERPAATAPLEQLATIALYESE